MKELLQEWRKYLTEIENRWEFSVLVRLEKDANLYADIFEKIRAIPGVTIVKTAEKQWYSWETPARIRRRGRKW